MYMDALWLVAGHGCAGRDEGLGSQEREGHTGEPEAILVASVASRQSPVPAPPV